MDGDELTPEPLPPPPPGPVHFGASPPLATTDGLSIVSNGLKPVCSGSKRNCGQSAGALLSRAEALGTGVVIGVGSGEAKLGAVSNKTATSESTPPNVRRARLLRARRALANRFKMIILFIRMSEAQSSPV